MRSIWHRVYHCSADQEGIDHPLKHYDKMHRKRGFRKFAYHFLIHLDGSIDIGRLLKEIGAHAKGKNLHSVGICYVGGLTRETIPGIIPKPKDTRTVAQVHALRALDKALESMFPGSEAVGHRDLSVDLNGDGVISKNEWMKDCPCFDVKTQL